MVPLSKIKQENNKFRGKLEIFRIRIHQREISCYLLIFMMYLEKNSCMSKSCKKGSVLEFFFWNCSLLAINYKTNDLSCRCFPFFSNIAFRINSTFNA